MKKLIAALLAFTLLSNIAMADCDYSTIVRNADGTYTYSKTIHLCVGEMKQDLEIANQQNEKYTKALSLKDLAIKNADDRADIWKAATFKLEDRVNSLDSMRSTNQLLYFGLGVATVLVAGYTASRLYQK